MSRTSLPVLLLAACLPGAVLLAIRGPRAVADPVPAPRSDYTVALVNIGEILRSLMDSDSFRDEREELIGELREEEESYRTELDDLRARMDQLDPESDEAQAVMQAASQRYEAFRTWQQQAMRRRGTLDAAQLERAYGELVTAVDIVAEHEGYDIVYRFIPPDEPFNTSGPDQAMMAIRLRTALRYPEEVDITELVRDEMDL